MNYLSTNVLELDGFVISVKKKKDNFNIQISKEILPSTGRTFEEINQLVTNINEESLHGSFYFCDGKLTFQMLLHEHLNEKSLKKKLNMAIATFDSILNMMEVF